MKKIEFKHVVLLFLFLILVVPALNTSSLYGKVSDLEGIEKTTSRYFLGIVFECCIFICVYAGYRSAGVFFAVLSLFIGLLFHIKFTDIREINDWYTHGFISKVFIQIGISTMVFFLSELYVRIKRKAEQSKEVANLSEVIAEKSERLAKLSEQEASQNKRLNEIHQMVSEKIELCNIQTKDLQDMEVKKIKIESEIKSLINKKNAMGTKKKKKL